MIAKEGKMTFGNITDGTSNTLMFAQRYQICNGQPTAWGYPTLYRWAPIFAYYSDGKFQSAPYALGILSSILNVPERVELPLPVETMKL